MIYVLTNSYASLFLLIYTGLVSLFNGISDSMRYLMPKPSLLFNPSLEYKGIQTVSERKNWTGAKPHDFVVKHIGYYAMGTRLHRCDPDKNYHCHSEGTQQ